MTPADVVREEWQRAVPEFKLRPGSPTEIVVARILERMVVFGEPKSELAAAIRMFAVAQARPWKVADLLKYLGDVWSSKEIYNALGGLTRRGKVQHLGYGEYR
jgi:hypothetical protein